MTELFRQIAPLRPRSFVLVHGIWHGGWCWSRVAAHLRARGHQVTTPTHTGLGERSHRMSESITLDTFVDDIVNHLEWEDLNEVVLVGPSFGGAPVSGAADRVPARIDRLIYLDAAIMEDAESWFGLLPGDIVADRMKLAEESSGGISLPPAPPSCFGVTDPADAAWLAPLGDLDHALELGAPLRKGSAGPLYCLHLTRLSAGPHVPRAFPTGPGYPPLAGAIRNPGSNLPTRQGYRARKGLPLSPTTASARRLRRSESARPERLGASSSRPADCSGSSAPMAPDAPRRR